MLFMFPGPSWSCKIAWFDALGQWFVLVSNFGQKAHVWFKSKLCFVWKQWFCKVWNSCFRLLKEKPSSTFSPLKPLFCVESSRTVEITGRIGSSPVTNLQGRGSCKIFVMFKVNCTQRVNYMYMYGSDWILNSSSVWDWQLPCFPDNQS